jgi:excisionase family DNA binding protein
MNEIETTLESVPAPRSTTRRSAPRTRFEQSKNGDAMPLLRTVDDAADLLRTTRRAIYAMLERRQLPGVIRIRRRVLIRSSELLEWLDQKRAPSLKE